MQNPFLKDLVKGTIPHGLIFDDSRHYLDHIAPFCSINNWPLTACEETIAKIARDFYPGLEVIETNILPSTVIACDPRSLIQDFFGTSPQKLLWLPHGNSDKGWKGSFFSPLQGEIALVYGQKLIDAILEEDIFPQFIRIGNFRCRYWLKYRYFYDTLIEEILQLPKAKITYLYAPTWDDREGNGSFWHIFPLLVAHLPEDCALIVKIHPNTFRQHEPKIEQWIGKYANRPNLCFLTEWLPIYPLLNLCDAYIGDMSSIGYDFLYWNRPMFFLKNGPSHFLHRCGIVVTAETIPSIFKSVYDDTKFQEIRNRVYDYTFDRSHQ